MKSTLAYVVSISAALLLSSQLSAQYQPYKSKDENAERCYVLVEKTGFEVTCTVLGSQQEVNNRTAQVTRENADRAKANRAVADEAKKLNTQIAAKERDLKKAADETAKADIQKAIDDLKSQVEQKRSELKMLVELIGPKHFSRRAEADKYIEAVYKEAEAAKAKAEQKEREKEKAKEEADKKNP